MTDSARALAALVLAIALGIIVRTLESPFAEAIASFEREPRVLYAEPNFVYRLSATPDDPLFGSLWGLHQTSDRDIDAPEAWEMTRGSKSIVVAVIDSGVAYDHPDLAPNVWLNDDPAGGGDNSTPKCSAKAA